MRVRKAEGVSSEFPEMLPGFEHINHYWDPTRNAYGAKILPGEYYVTVRNETIATVLGSCVSACIRDTVFGIGGMNHFMLPGNVSGDSNSWGNSVVSESARYGNYAMEHLINAILKYGGNRKNLEVKIFGGGRILAHATDVGRRNIEFVKNYMRVEGLRLAGEDTGDIYPRKVLYFPMTGKVMIKKLHAVHNNTIIERENAYVDQLKKEPVSGEIDLF